MSEEKLMKAMQDDEKVKQSIKAKLMAARDRPLQVRLKMPGCDDILIPSRKLRGTELINMTREFNEINPKLTSAEKLEMVELTPDENQKAYEVMDRYIELATGVEMEFLKQLDDVRIRIGLLNGIVQGSSLSPSEMEALKNFRS